MTEEKKYFKVVLPLKLEWEPWYCHDSELQPGQRVRVVFAGRQYVAVVSETGGIPDLDRRRIQSIVGVEEGLERISAKEIEFWRFIASYYLCTVGEAYKTAYPATLVSAEERKSGRVKEVKLEAGNPHLDAEEKDLIRNVLDSFVDRKPVLLCATDRYGIYEALAKRYNEEGKDVLILSPNAPKLSYPQQREVSKRLRGNVPCTLRLGKSSVFLPYTKLGLVIVDEEQSPSYKQDSQAPRYNGRDAGIALAGLHGADVLLGSTCPSLESRVNAASGKYSLVSSTVNRNFPPELVDTSAEFRKNGMSGAFSRIAISAIRETFESGGRVLLIVPWKDTRDIEIEARDLFPQARTRLCVQTLKDGLDCSKYQLVCLIRGEYLLSRVGFRADERSRQTIEGLCSSCRGRFIVQTNDASHPVWSLTSDSEFFGALINERKELGYPPFSRMVSVSVNDTNEARLAKMTFELGRCLGSMQFFLRKDKSLSSNKRGIADKVVEFEKERKYLGHIVLDVDPE